MSTQLGMTCCQNILDCTGFFKIGFKIFFIKFGVHNGTGEPFGFIQGSLGFIRLSLWLIEVHKAY